MISGRSGTVTDGMFFLLYEADSGAKFVRFNLKWLLNGEEIINYIDIKFNEEQNIHFNVFIFFSSLFW